MLRAGGPGQFLQQTVERFTPARIAGENPGSKYEAAKKLGVRILDEGEFLEMVQ